MPAPVSRTYLGSLTLSFVFSVISLGLIAYICKKGNGGVWPGPNGWGVVVQNVFAFAWATFFSLLFLVLSAVAPRSIFGGAAVNFIFIFLAFLQAVAGLGSYSAVVRDFGIPFSSSIWKAYWGIGWVATFVLLGTALHAGYLYIVGQATPAPQHKETEHF
ncbi:hypothetical protein JCM8097_007629 [Rhodosporidiobolus ruineniae]